MVKSKKLRLSDFQEVSTTELLEIKGGGGCPDCEDGSRCNGSGHANTNVEAATYAATGGGIFSLGTGGNPLAAMGAFVVGSLSTFFMENQMGTYYDNFSTQGSGSKVDIWADQGGYNSFPSTSGGFHNTGCGGGKATKTKLHGSLNELHRQ